MKKIEQIILTYLDLEPKIKLSIIISILLLIFVFYPYFFIAKLAYYWVLSGFIVYMAFWFKRLKEFDYSMTIKEFFDNNHIDPLINGFSFIFLGPLTLLFVLWLKRK